MTRGKRYHLALYHLLQQLDLQQIAMLGYIAEVAEKVRAHFAANPHVREPKVDAKTLGFAKSIAARFGEEI